MARIVVDTSALLALVSGTDEFHRRAVTTMQGLSDAREQLYLTSYVFLETSALVHRRLGFAKPKALVSGLEPAVQRYWIDPTTHDEAWDNLVRRNGAGLSLVDWTTAIVARRLNAAVFSFDEDFRQEGLLVVPG